MFEPLKAKNHADTEEGRDIHDWLERNRPEIETCMALLGCTATEAALLMLCNITARETTERNEPPPDNWGPGANPGDDD